MSISTPFPLSIPVLIISGEGIANDDFNHHNDHLPSRSTSFSSTGSEAPQFAPSVKSVDKGRRLRRFRESLQLRIPAQSPISKAHAAWSVRYTHVVSCRVVSYHDTRRAGAMRADQYRVCSAPSTRE